MPKRFLHELPDVADLYRVTGSRLGIWPQIIEKDYWLMHSLYSLQRQGFVFELKGGTSLSKGFEAIHRFSEDIDIHIQEPDDLPTGRNQDKPGQVDKRRQFFDGLAETIQVPGLRAVERDRSFDDEKMRSAGIRLVYPSTFQELPGLKPSVILEAGFDVTTPNEPRMISSWLYDEAARLGLDIVDNRAANVPCYLPEYTLVETLQTISTKFRKEQAGSIFPVNFVRHYYDVYQLLGLSRVQRFVGTKAYFAHKVRRFRTEDEPDLTKNEAFLLRDRVTRERYLKEYERTAAIYYKTQPTFKEILARFAEFLPQL